MIYTTFDSKWMVCYQSSGFALRDPTLHWGLLGDGVIRWLENDIREIVKDGYTGRVLERAADFGLIYGAIASSKAIKFDHKKCYLSCARNDRELTDAELGELRECLWEAIACYRVDSVLSDGEIAVIQLLAGGLTQDEIADKLQISRAGVRKRIERARANLNATNTIHAIAIAQSKGLIHG